MSEAWGLVFGLGGPKNNLLLNICNRIIKAKVEDENCRGRTMVSAKGDRPVKQTTKMYQDQSPRRRQTLSVGLP
jgi:hypothetical protein